MTTIDAEDAAHCECFHAHPATATRLPWLRVFGVTVTRAKIITVATLIVTLISAAPVAIAHTSSVSRQIDNPSDWPKLLRDIGVPGVMALAVLWAVWKMTPKALGLLDKMHASLDRLMAFVERIDKKIDEQEASDGKSMRELLEQIAQQTKERDR